MLRTYFAIAIAMLMISTSLVSSKNVNSINLIGAQGIFKSDSQLSNFFSSSAKSESTSSELAVVLDCSFILNNDCRLVNFLMNSDFPTEFNQITVNTVEDKVLIRVCFDQWPGGILSGSKAIEFCVNLQSPIVTVLSAENIEDAMTAHEQSFRSLFKKLNTLNTLGERSPLLFVVDSVSTTKEEILSILQNVWTSVSGQSSLEEAFDITLLLINSQTKEDLEKGKELINSWLISKNRSLEKNDIVGRLSKAWEEAETLPSKSLSEIEKRSLFSIEKSYLETLEQVQLAVGQLKKRVDNGKLVHRFGNRMKGVLTSTMKSFNDKVKHTKFMSERIERAQSLRDFVQVSASKLFTNQLEILNRDFTRKFRRELQRLHRSQPLDSSEESINADEMQQLVRKTLFDYKTAVSDLEDAELLKLTVSNDVMTKFSEKLNEIAKEYPESHDAKLEDLRRLERKISKPISSKKKKKRNIINMSMNLVGMLRTPGNGALQGFVEYATSLLSFPLNILIGVQSDGETPEIMGDDREHPFLRLQPKFHFDVEL